MSSSTPPLAPARAERRRRVAPRLALVFLFLLALVTASAVHWFRSAAQGAMPHLDGTIAVDGLHAPVSVIRDNHGVPSIYAQTLDDLFFAQGYVTAQDRLWQMDMMRRYAAGELAAALGPRYVELDRRQRRLGLREVARHSLAIATPQERAQLEAYARGVNAYIEEHQYGLPLEMRVLRYFPRGWTAEDSVLVGTGIAELLSHGTYLDDWNHARTVEKLGPQIADDLYPEQSQRDIIPGHESDAAEPQSAPGGKKESEASRLLSPLTRHRAATGPMPPHRDAMRPGSNNWVVSGAHTASGRPLLSNDMHLPARIPNTWYEAHLSCTTAACGDYDVAGVTLPGTPWVIVGHNRRIAWGFTNVGLDVEDLFVENFNSAGEYQTPQGWRKPEVRHEVIRVKRGRDVKMDVVVTRHGPIISGELPGEKRQIALQWSLFQSGLRIPFFAIDTANNWGEFRAALARYDGPGQNAVYADVDGNIGYQMIGRAPIRAAGDGSLPVSGADDAHEWTGWVPFDELPSVYNPPSGILATANGRVVPGDYKYVLTREWESPYRTERIYHVLRENKKFTPADMLALQMDIHSELDKFVAQRLVYAVDQTPQAGERVRQAAEILRHFDGNLRAESAGAAIEQRARSWLMETLLVSKLGADDAARYHWFMETVWLENMLDHQPARWLPPQYASWNALLEAAVEAAVHSHGAPKDLSTWAYGDYARVEISHPIFGKGLLGKIPWLREYASTGSWPMSGDNVTVKQMGDQFEPSERFTADLSDLARSTLNIVNGQSGNLFSPYFDDQFQAWYRGTTYQLPFDAQTVEKSAAHRLTLVQE